MEEQKYPEKKKCKNCGKVYTNPENHFYKGKNYKDGLRSECIKCCKKRSKKYYKNNKEQLKRRSKEWRENNKERFRETLKKWYEENKEYARKKTREYYENNKKDIRKKAKKYYENNREKELKRYREYFSKPKNKINRTLNTLMSQDLGDNKDVKKNKSWEEFADYNLEELMEHLEKQFVDGMKWDNYGEYWHISRIESRSDFDIEGVSDPDFKYLWSLDNIRPKVK